MNIKKSINNCDKKSSLILLSVPILLTIYLYHGKHNAFERYFNYLSANIHFDMFSHMYEYFMAFILLLIIPLILIKFVFKEKFNAYGLEIGDAKFGFQFTAIAVLLLIPFLYIGTLMPEMQSTYPEARSVIGSLKPFLLVECFYMLYYIGWEFFFRGYILFGLRKHFGDIAAILIQTIPSCIMHIGRPEPEILGSILIGILFGYLAIRTKSVLYPFLIHLFIGVFTDTTIASRF